MWIDIVCLVALLYGFWQGWSQGIIGTLLNLAIYAFGIVLAFKMAPVTSVILEKLLDSTHPLMFVGGFVANLLLIIILVKLATQGIENAMNGAYLGSVNRLIGGAVVGGFYVLLFSVIIWFLSQANGISSETKSISRTYPILQPLPGMAKSIAVRFQPLASDSWGDFMKWMEKAQHYGLEKTDGKGRVYELPTPDKNEPLFESKPTAPSPPPKKRDSDPIEE
jgi:uncharacterized membrane protein required for colicin V production